MYSTIYILDCVMRVTNVINYRYDLTYDSWVSLVFITARLLSNLILPDPVLFD